MHKLSSSEGRSAWQMTSVLVSQSQSGNLSVLHTGHFASGSTLKQTWHTCMVIWHLITFWVDNEALDWAGLQLPVNEVIQGLHKKLLLKEERRK